MAGKLIGELAPPSVIDDLARVATAGVEEVIWDLNIAGLDPHRQVAALEALASTLKA